MEHRLNCHDQSHLAALIKNTFLSIPLKFQPPRFHYNLFHSLIYNHYLGPGLFARGPEVVRHCPPYFAARGLTNGGSGSDGGSFKKRVQ